MKIGMIADNLGAPSFGTLLGTAAAGLPGVYSRFVAIVRMSARLLKSRNSSADLVMGSRNIRVTGSAAPPNTAMTGNQCASNRPVSWPEVSVCAVSRPF